VSAKGPTSRKEREKWGTHFPVMATVKRWATRLFYVVPSGTCFRFSPLFPDFRPGLNYVAPSGLVWTRALPLRAWR
jgi:hypothetical protein